MPNIRVIRTQQIDAPVSKVYQTISSIKTWEHWSPWIIMDPDTVVEVAADDKSYEWSGNRTGKGHMSISREEKDKSVDYDLTFLTPYKSKAKVTFTTTERDGGTEVAWHMDSSLPWFMFWMKKMMVGFIGNDYERGLHLLKDYVEDGEVHSKLNHIGNQAYAGCTFVGFKRTCSITEMPSLMQQDFEKLMSMAYQDERADPSGAFCQYHRFDFVKEIVNYTAGVPYSKIPTDLDPDLITGSLAASSIYTLEHVGSYHHIGNAWSTMYSMHRNKEISIKKGYHPFELYGNSPKDTKPHDLITYVNFAVK